LTTVVATVCAFTDKYPDAWIYATGSTKARTRLYRMGIAKFISEVEADFEVLGERNDDWEPFVSDVDYEGFLVRRRKESFLPLTITIWFKMKITKELKKRKTPIVKIDKSLNKYDSIVLFPDKQEKANEMLRRVGLPKQWTNERIHN